MLQLSLLPDEYLTINGNIVVQLARVSGSRAYLRVDADRSVPIVRGKVLERAGVSKPECLSSLPRNRSRRRGDAVYYWSADRERAARRMEQILSQMEENGSQEEAESLRTQLNRLIPTHCGRRRSPAQYRPHFKTRRQGDNSFCRKSQQWFHPESRSGWNIGSIQEGTSRQRPRRLCLPVKPTDAHEGSSVRRANPQNHFYERKQTK